jgi:hypothetical protein
MSDQISTALVKGFKKNFQLLAQQKSSRLRMAVREEELTGEDDFFDQIGASDGTDITDRHGDTVYAQTPHARRKVFAQPWQWGELIDKPDKVRMLGDPQSTYVKAAVASAGRRIDDHIIGAFFGSAWTGKTGTTEVTFPAANVVPVNLSGSNEGLTVNKLIRAKRILWDYDVDEDVPFHIAVTGTQLEDLLKTTQVTSADYNSVKALVKGEIDQFMGFTFHRLGPKRLLKDGSNYRRIPVWVEDGMLLGVAMEVIVRIDELPQKRYSTQIYVQLDMGATRMEEEKVVEIKCLEA